ncbi:MAG: hypothetical protein GX153_11395 [Clostridiaceae bacterium]|nr:hypothetical protein [Clostridiaceae bacterium]
MNRHLYLTLIPEALIASMLTPEEFASYYAIGEHDKPNGQVIFIEIDPSFRSSAFQIEKALVRCVPTPDGLPKKSVYVSIYRVLEHIPISAMGDMYYVTRDGRTLKTSKSPAADNESGLHFYSELAPTRPAVVSPLGPLDFLDLMLGNRAHFPGMPAIAFVELALGALATDPENGDIDVLPYENIVHLRRCLQEAITKTVSSKLFDLGGLESFPYRVVKNGVFVGNRTEGLSIYRMPPQDVLQSMHRAWWRSANT